MESKLNIKVGDIVTRFMGCEREVMMDLAVTEITDTLIVCGAWTFDRNNGAEIDEELGWDANGTGSFIEKKFIEKKQGGHFVSGPRYRAKEIIMIFLGDCRDDLLVEDIFGSVSEFARQVEENGDEFLYGDVRVVYSPEADVHEFWQIPRGGRPRILADNLGPL